MRLFRRRPPQPKPRPLRRGLIDIVFTQGGLIGKSLKHSAVAEVSEWERIGNRSRITVDRITGVPAGLERQATALVPAWVPTANVVWRPS